MLELALHGGPEGRAWTRRAWLRTSLWALGGACLAARPRGARAASRANDAAVIQIWLGGGPSHIDMYDPKPAASEQVRGPYRTIATSVPGVRIAAPLARQAELMHRLAIVRSLHHE